MTKPRIYRERVDLTQEKAADQLGTSVRQLQRYEAGANIPEDMLLRMAVIYRAPELLLMITETSPVHEQLGELTLNNINTNPVAALVKYIEELNEAIHATQSMMNMIFNLDKVPEKVKPTMVAMMEQGIYDVKTALSRAEVSVLGVVGVETGIEARRRHRDKCLQRGYLIKEKQPGLVAERQAAYQ